MYSRYWTVLSRKQSIEGALMTANSRRDFLKIGSAALVCGSAFFRGNILAAEDRGMIPSLNVPLGLELYSVRELLPKDYDGTLKKVAELGYREVEAAGYFKHTPSQVKEAMRQAGLRCVSSHHNYASLHADLDAIVAFNKQVGVRTIICSSPARPPRDTRKDASGRPAPFALEDWRWGAEEFNKLGEKINAAGLKFGYHNHTTEFKKVEGVVPYEELMRLTDPSKVTMEMDCGWVIVGGGDPIDLLKRYPTRISMLHVKDFKSKKSSDPENNPPPATELGQGVIDYAPIFKAAAKTGHVKHCFVEQEEFDMPPMESLKIDADYMRTLKRSKK